MTSMTVSMTVLEEYYIYMYTCTCTSHPRKFINKKHTNLTKEKKQKLEHFFHDDQTFGYLTLAFMCAPGKSFCISHMVNYLYLCNIQQTRNLKKLKFH